MHAGSKSALSHLAGCSLEAKAVDPTSFAKVLAKTRLLSTFTRQVLGFV